MGYHEKKFSREIDILCDFDNLTEIYYRIEWSLENRQSTVLDTLTHNVNA